MTTRRFVRSTIVGTFVVGGVLALGAQAPQAPQPAPSPQTPPAASAAQPAIPRVTLTAGRSLVLPSPFDITRVAITNPAVADATVVAPREILLDGKTAGTVSLIVWGASERAQYDLVVDPTVSALQRQLQTIFPGEDIQSNETPDSVVLTGHASNNSVMLRAAEIAEALAPKAKVINLLQLPGGSENQQVSLQVRIAEVNRRALTELGVSIFTGPTGVNNVVGIGTTGQFPGPGFNNLQTVRDGNGLASASGEIVLSDFLNLFLFSNQYNVGVLIKALQTNGNYQTLAEPNLIAYNGQEASFLAGGELPVPVVQGTGNTGQVTIIWREFGVRLTFRPTIAGDVIRLRVKPEVSALDYANGITLSGFRIPALTTRRAETDVELRDGQSFAIAGLMSNTAQETKEAIPFLSSIPIIGKLFQSKATNREKTELLVLVTPRLVRPLNPDEVPLLPTSDDKFLKDEPGVAGTLLPSQTPPPTAAPAPGAR